MVEFPFAGTILSGSSFVNKAILPYIRRYDDGGTEPQHEPEPRILIDGGNFPVQQFFQNDRVNILGFDFFDIPFTYFVKQQFGNVTIDLLNFNLAFDNPDNTIQDTPISESDYKEVIDILNEPAFVKLSLKLSAVDILKIDWSVPVYIDKLNAYFYINKIDQYDFSGKSTPVELIKLN